MRRVLLSIDMPLALYGGAPNSRSIQDGGASCFGPARCAPEPHTEADLLARTTVGGKREAVRRDEKP